MNECEKYGPMIIGMLDNELTAEETQELNRHLDRCAGCRKEFEEQLEVTGMLQIPSFKEPEDEVLEKLWNSPYSRFTRNAGIVMVVAGYLALIGYGLYEFMIDKSEAVFPKVSVAAILIGFVVLLGGVIRERMHTYKHDKYKEVER